MKRWTLFPQGSKPTIPQYRYNLSITALLCWRMELSEDEIYRSSTQYRFWSYTLESLASLRSTTNGIASAHVKDAIARHHAKAQSTESGLAGSTVPVIEVDCLTVDEELKLVLFYCSMTLELADFCELPTHVKVRWLLTLV